MLPIENAFISHFGSKLLRASNENGMKDIPVILPLSVKILYRKSDRFHGGFLVNMEKLVYFLEIMDKIVPAALAMPREFCYNELGEMIEYGIF